MQVHGVGGAGGVDEARVRVVAGGVLPGRGLQRGEVGNIRVVEAEDAAGAAGEEEIAARRQAGGVHARATVADGVVLAGSAVVAAGVDKDVVLIITRVGHAGAAIESEAVCRARS